MVALTEMVARSLELAEVLQLLESAAAGEPGLVLVAGAAGIGKTRLVAEVSDHAERGAWTVLTGGCVELSEGATTLGPVAQVVRQLGHDRGEQQLATLLDGPAAGLAPLVPELGLDTGPADDPSESRVLVSFHRLLIELSRERPVLLVLEDVHWADAATRDLLRHLVTRMRDERLAVVATVRTDDLDRRHPIRPVLAELVRRPEVNRVDLSPLDDASMMAHLAALAPRATDETRLAAVVERAQGNPFFAEQLLLGGTRGEADLPPSLQDALWERLEQLPSPARILLGELAVLGTGADGALLEAVTSLSPATAGEVVRAVVDRGVVLVDGTHLVFQHELLREATLARLLPNERVAAHVAAARALEGAPELALLGPVGAHAQIAHHWWEAGELSRCLAASVVATNQAMRVFASREALSHCRRVIELWGQVENPEELTGTTYPAVLLTALRAADAADDDSFRELGDAAIREATMAGEPETGAVAVQVLVRALNSGGFEHAALDVVATELDRQAGAITPAASLLLSTHAAAVGSVGELRAEPWDLDEVASQLDQALDVARACGDWYGEYRALVDIAQTLGPYLPDRFDAAVDSLRGLTQEPDRLVARNAAHAVATYVPYLCGDFVRAAAALDRWRASAAQSGVSPLDSASMWSMGLHHDVWSGRIAAAARRIHEVDIRDHEGHPSILTWMVSLSGDPLRWTGDAQRALGYAEFAVEVAPRGFVTMPVVAELAASRAAVGASPHQVLAAVRGVETSFGARNWHVYVPRLVEAVTTAAGDLRIDEDLLAVLDGFVGRLDRYVSWLRHDAPLRSWATACLQRAQAERAFLTGTPDPSLWDPVVADFEQRGGIPHAARARLRRASARAAAEGGSSDECERDLLAAWHTFSEVGLQALEADARALAQRLRIRLPRRGPRSTHEALSELTDREREILQLVARGWTNRRVGEHLFISPKTVSAHLSNLMRKLDVGSRTEAVLVARSAGLVPEP